MAKSILIGIASGLILLGIYLAILMFANGPEHVASQFIGMWYLITPLVIGFGVQVGLFSFVRDAVKASAAGVASTGGVTTGSMIACCVHHVADIVPVIGLSAAGLFLIQYQAAFMLLGVLSNIVGITMMLHIIQKHSLYGKRFAPLFSFDMIKIRNITAILSIFAFTAFVILAGLSATPTSVQASDDLPITVVLPVKDNSENGLSIQATPRVSDENTIFDMSFTTHSGDLKFDLEKNSILATSDGEAYSPQKWEGPQPGGHHLSGRLVFPALKGNLLWIKLVVKDLYGVEERVFEWENL